MGAFFGIPQGTHNNAPQPVPITGSVGTNTPSSKGGGSPSFPLFGSLSANNPIFGNIGISGLSSGLPGAGALSKPLGSAYGSGTGNFLTSLLQNGLFNPQVASAFLNSMQSGVNSGVASLQQSFGAEGSRFGSAAALGIGDYLSQVNLNEESVMANMFLTAQGEELNLLQNLLPTIHAERANSGGILSDILGGAEIAGGIGSLFIPGLQGLAAPLISGGVGTVAGQGKGGGNNTTPTKMPDLSPIFNNSNSSAAQIDASASGGYNPNNIANSDVLQSISAGATLGGEDPFSSKDGSDMFGSSTIDLLFGINPLEMVTPP